MKISRVVLLVALLLTFGAFNLSPFGSLVRADEGAGSDDDSRVETEDEVYEEGEGDPGTGGADGEPEDLTPQEVEVVIGPASDVETAYIFTKYSDDELPAGKIINCLISFHNSGASKKAYLVESIFASIRYPMDYTYHLQNFTRLHLNKTVEVNREASFSYVFRTSDHFSGRPFGFVVEVNYFDDEENPYLHTVFNKTINFVEVDEAFDAEAIMLYILFGAVGSLVVVIVYYYMSGGNKKGGKRGAVETGKMETNGAVHNEWLPDHVRKSPKVVKPNPTKSPKKSKKDN